VPHALSKMLFANRLYILVHLYHDGVGKAEELIVNPRFFSEDIDYYRMSSNPNVTWQLIEEYSDKPWNYEKLLQFLPITKQVLDRPEFIQYSYSISANPTLTLELIDLYYTYKWNWTMISINQPLKTIFANPGRPWIWFNVMMRSDVLQMFNDGHDFAECQKLSNTIREYYKFVSGLALEQPNGRLQEIGGAWARWNIIAMQSNMPMNQLIPLINERSASAGACLVQNPNMTMDIINSGKLLTIDWPAVSGGHLGTIDNVIVNPKHPWSWYHLSSNPRITSDDIKKYVNFKWYDTEFLKNPSWSVRDILANKSQYWNKIGENLFTHNPYVRNTKIRRHLMQKYGRRWIRFASRHYHESMYRHVMHHLLMWARDSDAGNLKHNVHTFSN